MYGELEGSWGRPDLGYEHGAGRGGVSGFTSNFRRSKSFRYSMARGLGGREGMGREGEDMVSAAATAAAGGSFNRVCPCVRIVGKSTPLPQCSS